MKNLQELYDKILSSNELKKEFAASATSEEAAAPFLKKYECSASVEGLKEFMKEKRAEACAKLSEAELAATAAAGERKEADVPDGVQLAGSLVLLGGCLIYSAVAFQVTDQHCIWQ